MAVDSRLVKVLAGMYKEAQLHTGSSPAIPPVPKFSPLRHGPTLPGYEYLPDAQLSNATPTPLPARGASMSRYILPAAAILAAIGGGAALASRKRKQEEEKQRNAL